MRLTPREFVTSRWPGATVEIYGSHVTGLSLFTSDIDTVVMGIPEEKPIYALGDGLYQVIRRPSDVSPMPI